MKYTGALFNSKKAESTPKQIEATELISIQTVQLRQNYNTECLDAKQLQQALNVGETNVYKLIKNCPTVRVIGRRKVIPIIAVATYLVTGKF